MLGLSRNHGTDGWIEFTISGEIDEEANLYELFGNLPAEFRLNTSLITRMNSVGMRRWIDFFGRAQEQGLTIVYQACSQAFTNHLAIILAAVRNQTVETVMAPFVCTRCSQEFAILVTTADIQSIKPQLLGRSCPGCSSPAEFDEIPQEYFSFLS